MTFMNKSKSFLKRYALKLAVAAVLSAPVLAGAQVFQYNHNGGDVCAGFRKTGTYADAYEAVANFGNFTNFLKLTPGTTMTMSNLSATQLKDCFSEGNSNLQWSAWGFIDYNSGSTAYGSFSNQTLFFTLPNGTNLNSQTVAPVRDTVSNQGGTESQISGCEQGASLISSYLITSNQDNTPYFVRESVATYPNYKLSAYIADVNNPSIGDFGAGYGGFGFDIEDVNPVIFNAPQRADLYLSVPGSTDANSGNSINYFNDPLTGLTNGPADMLGYFIFYPNATITFTRAFGVTATATTGSAPLKVVFSTTATNTAGATNWVWNFGNGTIITNTTSASVTNIYAAAGSYTVTLTINGSNGPVTLTLANYVVATAPQAPVFTGITFSGGKLVVNGMNGTGGSQYRVLMSTNLSAGSWIPVFTNQFLSNGSFSYTNGSPTNGAGFFRVISP